MSNPGDGSIQENHPANTTENTSRLIEHNFTLYTVHLDQLHRTPIRMHYQPPTSDARLGTFVWKPEPTNKSQPIPPWAEEDQRIPVHLISDVFLVSHQTGHR